MSDDFEERLKRAAKDHAAKSDANGGAKKLQEGERKAFLVQFYDLSRNVIEPVLNDAVRLVEAPGKVNARVQRSDKESEISLELTTADGQISVLVFIADPLLMRVRIHSAVQIGIEDLGAGSRWWDAKHGTGSSRAIATMTLEEVAKRDDIKRHAAEFVEHALA
jgi:hypothetical protein